MWKQAFHKDASPRNRYNFPYNNKPGCASFLIGVINGKVQDIRILDRAGLADTIKYLIGMLKTQKWNPTEHNPEGKPAIAHSSMSFYTDDNPELPQECSKIM